MHLGASGWRGQAMCTWWVKLASFHSTFVAGPYERWDTE